MHALDAPADSQPGTLQPEMSREAAVGGGLDMQLVYYRKREAHIR